MISGMVALVWFAGKYHWSQWQLAGVFLMVIVPYGILWWWVKDRVKLNQIRSGRRLARSKVSSKSW
jgi:hypothetical protein